ncbi:superoxide dismutase [Chitinophaga sp. GCM10012297]|uniref:Superoxide dismutase n=1 Tax=Chitinophaga chungangae TaxID=2821488 RepID=A0ABS3YCF4_9BACT|nr:superoxide dismutase [Chitinophaga chungangae]MBO9152344.1 superoxide dismutase [Chitinophaga chungangae]
MNKREFIKVAGLAGIAALVAPGCAGAAEAADGNKTLLALKPPFVLPELPYAVDALEPNIDKMTMEIHHGKHHAGYVTNLNKAVEQGAFAGLSLGDILTKVSAGDTAVRNNAGGHYNHSLFWKLMSAGKSEPSGELKKAIDTAFGSMDELKTKFADAGKGVFGSGWAWVIVKTDGSLAVTSTPNQDNPLMTNLAKDPGTPILGVDVWEHAYYLKYQNKRPDYLTAFWNVVNWTQVNELYTEALKK